MDFFSRVYYDDKVYFRKLATDKLKTQEVARLPAAPVGRVATHLKGVRLSCEELSMPFVTVLLEIKFLLKELRVGTLFFGPTRVPTSGE